MSTVTIPAAESADVRGTFSLTVIVCFAFTVFLSAFLLFQVQLIVTKYILPWFGGTEGVWTTCMLVFQLLLYELNPDVIQLSSGPHPMFTYVRDSPARKEAYGGTRACS